MTYATGPVLWYEGGWVNGKREGQAKQLWKRKDKFHQGEWKNDKLHGYGVLTENDGGRYEGFYEENKRHGQGKQR